VSEPQPPTSRRAARVVQEDAASGLPTGDRTSSRRLGIIIGAGVLVFVLLGTGAVFAGIAVGHTTASTAPLPASSAAGRIVPGDQVAPTAIPTCSIDSLASKKSLMTFSGSVVQTSNSNVLYANSATDAAQPGGILKVLTAAAAISALGPSTTIATNVYDDAQQPGTIVLQGNGDPTLSRSTSGSIYSGAPTLTSLASKTMSAYNSLHSGVPITAIILDSSLWDPSNPVDPSSLQSQGKLSIPAALQVDGDRANPKLEISPRSADPVTAAGNAFATALGLDPSSITFTQGEPENGAKPIATVHSQPVSVLVKQMLSLGDDTLAENLARLVSVKEKLGGGSSSVQNAITTALGKYGLDTSGLTIVDGSGESDETQIPPLFMSQFMALVSMKNNGLQYVAAGFLSSGGISMKTGSLPTADTISGYLTAKDGTGEAFTFYAVGQGVLPKAKAVLASLAQAVDKCGKNITNN
jgi:D-alanyl-D-alanine carboxypeptidase/D-alanyl-D-alanine-endopeptidase (penicillin-binding protein 4)